MIIKVYGEYWSRDRVDWSRRAMLGVRKGKKPCNVWQQRGIYALYKDFELAYVGKADTRHMGVRLKEHTTDRFAERWNAFSFFGICEVDAHGNAKQPVEFAVGSSTVIRSLELLAILLANAPLNRARGKFPDGAEKVWQIEPDKPSKTFHINEKLSKITNEIEQLRKSLAARSRRVGEDQVE